MPNSTRVPGTSVVPVTHGFGAPGQFVGSCATSAAAMRPTPGPVPKPSPTALVDASSVVVPRGRLEKIMFGPP